MRTKLVPALLIAAFVGALWTTAAAKDEKAAPLTVTVAVKGLKADSAKAIEKALKALEAVTDAKADAKSVLAQVKAEKTLKLSDVLGAIAAASSEKDKLEADRAGVALLGTAAITVDGMGDAKDDDVIAILKGVPNVEKVEGSKGTYDVTFKGAKGTTVGEVEKALQAKTKEASVKDVSWTAPKEGKAGGHG